MIKTAMPPKDDICKVTSICWSNNNHKMAVVTADRVIHLFDESGVQKDRFSTKPTDKGPKNYIVRAMQFSPDSRKLAVAQSDNIIFVYNLGLEWGAKKSIVNKFKQSSSVTCLTWPQSHPNKIVFGLSEGKVRLGQTRKNKSATMYVTESHVVSCCASPDGNSILSGHLDGTIYRFFFEGSGGGAPAHMKFAQHTAVPYCLDYGTSVVAAGSDGAVIFYDPQDGSIERKFDYSNDSKVKEFTSVAISPSGECAVLGNFNRFYVYGHNARTGTWEESSMRSIDNLYSVTALSWKADGSRLSVGALCGVVDIYDACLKRCRYRGKYEFTYVSLSQVLIKELATGAIVNLKSSHGHEITSIDIFQERFIVAKTLKTLLTGDMVARKLSEIPWRSSGKEKFDFTNPAVCMAFNAGELTIVEYGHNSVLGSCRTEHVNTHLVSIRINERKGQIEPLDEMMMMGGSGSGENKKLAYLMDLQTIRVQDLAEDMAMATINHDSKIDFLELNARGNILIFRDKRRQLLMYQVDEQRKTTLLGYCNYAQWVPNSDVVVGQNRSTLCVWYNVLTPDKVTKIEIQGDVLEIERGEGVTQVIVDEDGEQVGYELDEGLIGFGTAVDDGDLLEAMSILEKQETKSPESRGMWKQLSDLAVMDGDLAIAERCAAALGNVARCRFLRQINKLIRKLPSGSKDHWMVKARIAMLRGDFKTAEIEFIDQGKIDEAIEMYRNMHRWDRAIEVAEENDHPESKKMREEFLEHLMSSGQEDKAGELKEKERDYISAISLYLRGGMPAKAASVVTNHPGTYSPDLLEQICGALCSASLHVRAGAFYERLDQLQRALDCYVKGHGYREAVKLARHSFPGKVVWLEEAWANWLSSQGQLDAAINHYIEAGVLNKAVDAAIKSRQWQKAVTLVEDTLTDDESARPYYLRIAQHFASASDYAAAERYFVKAGRPELAVKMYTASNRWEEAHSVAMGYMSEVEVTKLYISQARRMERGGHYDQAEKLYVKVKKPDLAIEMYKKSRKLTDMIRLVSVHRKGHLKETHLHLAQQLEMEGALKEAEHHYTRAQEWQSAVNMYRANTMWDEAIRVAKYNGGVQASKQVAYAWAMSLGGEAGAKLLRKLGLIEQAIDYAIERRAFDHAFELARTCMKKKIPEVHLKHALHLEDEEHFKEAEEEFIRAGKPKEAIDMFLHQQDWSNAMRVAELHDPSNIPEVLVAQGVFAQEQKDHRRAESFFVDAKKPEKALRMYQDAKMWNDAIRVAKLHLPHKLHAINMARQRASASGGDDGDVGDDVIATARMWESQGDYDRAINAYVKMSAKTVPDERQLLKAWDRAVHLASVHKRGALKKICVGVAENLVAVGQHAQAGRAYVTAACYKDAVECFIRVGDWKSARDITRDQATEYRDYVEKAYRSHVVRSDNPQGCIETGNVGAGLDIYAQRGQWKKVFEVCKNEKPSIRGRYAFKYATKLMSDGKPLDAARALAEHGVCFNRKYLNTYKTVAKDVLGMDMASEKSAGDGGKALYATIRTFLFQLVSIGQRTSSSESKTRDDSVVGDFERLLMIAHFFVMRRVAAEKGHHRLTAKLSIALLRDCGQIPWDKAFLNAGDHCHAAKCSGLAYLFYNRFLDVSEAVEEGDSSGVDNTDFIDTDIPTPYNMDLPSRPYVDEDYGEDVRNRVLSWALEDSEDADAARKALLENLESARYLTKRFRRSLAGWLTEGGAEGRRIWDDAFEFREVSRVD
eukprot:g124.t1